MMDSDQIARAAALIVSGGVVAFPTETVYGLGANALDPVAIRKIYQLKQRPATSPLIVHVNSIAMAKRLVRDWPVQADALAEKFWPGPLTLVLPKSDVVPKELTAGLNTVGIRMPSHPVALALIEAAGLPIAAPSANRFMQLSPTRAEHVRESLGSSIDLTLDAGPTTVGIESTVLSLSTDPPTLLRPGMITRSELEAVLGPIATLQSIEGGHASPGLHAKHYSPRTPLYILELGQQAPAGSGIYLYHSQPRKGMTPKQMPNAPEAYASAIYQVLHDCDRQGWDFIAIEPLPLIPNWDGIRDRLERASIR